MNQDAHSLTTPTRVDQMVLDLETTGMAPFSGHLAKLYECYRYAFDQWKNLGTQMPSAFPHLSNRTRASYLYDLACTRAKELFQGDTSIHLTDKRGFLILIIENKYVLRLRKLDNKNLACQSNTRQSQLYFSGRLQMPLPNIADDLVPMICGYKLDSTETAIKKVALSFQYKRRILWFQDVPDLAIDVEEAPDAKMKAPESGAKPRTSPRARVTAKRGVQEVDAPEENQK